MKTFFEMMKILEQENEQSPKPVGPEQGDQEDVRGTPDQVQSVEPTVSVDNTETPGDLKHYMFFGNLKVMKNKIEEILSMDAHKIDEMLADGHDWACDHVSTSRDDIEEVYNWIVGTK